MVFPLFLLSSFSSTLSRSHQMGSRQEDIQVGEILAWEPQPQHTDGSFGLHVPFDILVPFPDK